jgi:hypothetical protein
LGQQGRICLEKLRIGRRVLTWLATPRGERVAASESEESISHLTHRLVCLSQESEGGGRLNVRLLRPLEWLAIHEIVFVGDLVELDLPEMGAVGEFRVESISDGPEIEEGPGRIVTGEFHFSDGEAYSSAITPRTSSTPARQAQAPRRTR